MQVRGEPLWAMDARHATTRIRFEDVWSVLLVVLVVCLLGSSGLYHRVHRFLWHRQQ